MLDAYLERIAFLKEKYPALYLLDKRTFCVACAQFYRQSLAAQQPGSAAVRSRIRALRKKVSFSRSEMKMYSMKDKLYILGTGYCMDTFCRVLNLVRGVAE